MKINNLYITLTDSNEFYLEWTPLTSAPDYSLSPNDFDFKIYYSYDPASGFDVIKDDEGDDVVINGPYLYTHDLEHTIKDRDRYYKIIAYNKVDPSITVESDIQFVNSKRDGISDSIRYGEDLLYKNYIGQTCLIYKRNSEGARCPDCWNNLRKTRTKTHCDTCHGTGFIESYFTPIEAQLQFEQMPTAISTSETGEDLDKKIKIRASNYPLLRYRDLIVRKSDNKRFNIVNINKTCLPALSIGVSNGEYIISQIVAADEILPDDNRYGDLDG